MLLPLDFLEGNPRIPWDSPRPTVKSMQHRDVFHTSFTTDTDQSAVKSSRDRYVTQTLSIMNTIISLRNACDALLYSGLYPEISGIEILNWGEGDSPERGVLVRTTSIGETEIREWEIGGFTCLHIKPYGWFKAF